MKTLSVVVLSAVLLSGCIDLVIPPAEGASLFVTVELADNRSPDDYTFEAQFSPGRDLAGRLREVPDPTLTVRGLAIKPLGLDEFDRYLYRQQFPFDPDTFLGDSVIVEAPSTTSLPEIPPPIVTRTVWRGGSGTVTLSPGEDLLLSLAFPQLHHDSQAVDERWRLMLSDQLGFALQLSSSGSLPATIGIPWNLFGEEAESDLHALLIVTRIDVSMSPDGQYVSRVLVIVTLEWVVELSEV